MVNSALAMAIDARNRPRGHPGGLESCWSCSTAESRVRPEATSATGRRSRVEPVAAAHSDRDPGVLERCFNVDRISSERPKRVLDRGDHDLKHLDARVLLGFGGDDMPRR